MLDSSNTVILKEGLIVRSLSGFYNVKVNNEIFVSKPKGIFRHNNVKPIVGDRVIIEIDQADDHSDSRIIEILSRDNELVRPPMANVDYALLVMSFIEPKFSYLLLDQYLLTLEYKGIIPIILLTKFDLLCKEIGEEEAIAFVEAIQNVYQRVGYKIYVRHHDSYSIMQDISNFEKGIYVVMGQSGVGKSTFLNQILDNIELETNDISQSLNRGKHTTRQVTLYSYKDLLLADTPGFSSLEIPDVSTVELTNYFPDLFEASQGCKFRSCIHTVEPKCEVLNQVNSGQIAPSRYESYLYLLDKIQIKNDNFKY